MGSIWLSENCRMQAQRQFGCERDCEEFSSESTIATKKCTSAPDIEN
ncbi:MAG: hypothetical protein ACLUDP_21295 [[Clostridium] innocuum]